MVYTKQLKNVKFPLVLTEENERILNNWIELKKKQGFTDEQIQEAFGRMLANLVEVDLYLSTLNT